MIRAEDFAAARLGGDEFAVLCKDIPDPATTLELATRLCTALSGPVILQGVSLLVVASVGVALSPTHADEVDVLPDEPMSLCTKQRPRVRVRWSFMTPATTATPLSASHSWLNSVAGSKQNLSCTTSRNVADRRRDCWRGSSSRMVAHPKLALLGDIFATPRWLPAHDVFSIGDVLIVVAVAVLVYMTCTHNPDTTTQAPDQLSPSSDSPGFGLRAHEDRDQLNLRG